MAQESESRLGILDGLRGIAILVVMGYHYYSRWLLDDGGSYYPYGAAWRSAFQHGHFGVQLFFTLSGFVIAMALTRAKSPWDFASKRLAKIFPMLAIAATLTLALTWTSPRFHANPADLLPSISLVPLFLWEKLLHRTPVLIDGAYWSLFVEAQFYVLAAMLFFLVKDAGERFLLRFLIVSAALAPFPILGSLKMVGYLVEAPFFASGVAFYYLFKGEQKGLAGALLALSAATALGIAFLQNRHELGVVYALVAGIFALFVYRPTLIKWLAWRPLAAIGLASYLLYLYHQNLGVEAIYRLGEALRLSGPVSVWVGLVVWAAILGVGVWLHPRFEEPVRKCVLSKLAARPKT